MLKAFLSHSHQDAELVRAVASKVGRPFVHLDVNSFHAADDLISCMEHAVRESAIFVYFASRAAMSSAWVNFEVNEARYHQALSRIRKVIVVVLDSRIAPRDFPSWMQRSVFLQSKAVGPIARAIRAAIDDMVQDQQHSHFVGRAQETEALQAAFVPPDTSQGVPLVALRGLPGIGRRTLLKRVARDALSIANTVVVRIEPGDDINSVAIKLADLVEPIATPDESLHIARTIQVMSPKDALERCIGDLVQVYRLNELAVFYDDGGLLANDGTPVRPIGAILEAIAKRSDLLAAVVTNRRPSWKTVPELVETPIVHVQPLRQQEMRQLLALQAKSRSLSLTGAEIAKLVTQARGYPPAASAIISLIETYGSAMVLRNQSQEAAYQPRPLTRYLKSLKLGSSEQNMLRVLARNSPLPIDLLLSFESDQEAGLRALAALIDASLVAPQPGTSWYRISDPIIAYVEREFAPCTVEDYTAVADGIERLLDTDRDSGPYLDLSRVLYRALTHAGRPKRSKAFALVSDWLRLAEEFYHQRDYTRSLDLAAAANEARQSVQSLSWIAKSEVKLGHYQPAVDAIDAIRALGEVAEAHFLRGFLDRNRSRHSDAIGHYESARRAGRGGLALERDLAECYFHVGDYERAASYIAAAQERQSDNPYILSLRIKIACRQRDEATARSLLPLLDEVDTRSFAAHHHARVDLTFGSIASAYDWAVQAVGDSRRPPIEVLSTLVLIQILTKRYKEARQGLDRLASLYPSQRREVQNGLQARLAIAEMRYEDALGYIAQFEARDNAVHLALKRDALRGLLDHASMAGDKRREMEREVEDLDAQLRVKYGGTEWEVETD